VLAVQKLRLFVKTRRINCAIVVLGLAVIVSATLCHVWSRMQNDANVANFSGELIPLIQIEVDDEILELRNLENRQELNVSLPMGWHRLRVVAWHVDGTKTQADFGAGPARVYGVRWNIALLAPESEHPIVIFGGTRHSR